MRRLAGLKIIICMKINASYFEFRSASSLHDSNSILLRNSSRGLLNNANLLTDKKNTCGGLTVAGL